MGHSRASKTATHERLVQMAAARFKERGVDGISLSDLMKELGLTHGGFYKHFTSRDELVTEALELALADSGKMMRDRLSDGSKQDMSAFVNFYLGDAHCEARADGCTVAALAGDAARKGSDMQAQFREHIDQNLDVLSDCLSPRSADAGSRAQAIFLLSALYGALTMARAAGDSPFAREVLRTVRKKILNTVVAPPVAARKKTARKNAVKADS